jgi:hypothetical protein
LKKLFTCLYGSRLYGTQTPTSDRDVKHIVLPDLDDLLLGAKLVNKVKKTNTEKNTRNTAEDVDEEFIPVQVFARDFFEGQTYALELAFAVNSGHAEQTFYDEGGRPLPALAATASEFWTFTRALRNLFLTSNIKAMMGYAVNQASLYSFKGERLNAVRQLLDYLEMYEENYSKSRISELYDHEYHGMFIDQMKAVERMNPKYFKVTEYDIGGGVMKPCFTLLEKTLPFSSTVQHTLGVVRTLEQKYGSRADAASQTNVDWKAVMHALRIVDEGNMLLMTGSLSFPLPADYVERLLSIKRGEHDIEAIKAELDTKLSMLKQLEKSTKLPPTSPELKGQLDRWLALEMRKMYRI